MARLGCICGADMSNTVVPSKHLLMIYSMSEIDNAISYNPDILLWDFYCGWDEKTNEDRNYKNKDEVVEYWYCTECKRIHKVQAIPCGKIIKTYVISDIKKEDIIKDDFEKVFFFWDIDMDKKLNENKNETLKEFVERTAEKNYYDIINNVIFCCDKNNRIIKKYCIESKEL